MPYISYIYYSFISSYLTLLNARGTNLDFVISRLLWSLLRLCRSRELNYLTISSHFERYKIYRRIIARQERFIHLTTILSFAVWFPKLFQLSSPRRFKNTKFFENYDKFHSTKIILKTVTNISRIAFQRWFQKLYHAFKNSELPYSR